MNLKPAIRALRPEDARELPGTAVKHLAQLEKDLNYRRGLLVAFKKCPNSIK